MRRPCYIFTLTLTDDDGETSTNTTVTVTITAVLVDILVNAPEVVVQEGGAGAYQVKFRELPHQEVIIMGYSDNEDVVLKYAHLLFNAGNWDTWQKVTINTVADSDKRNDSAWIMHSLVTDEVDLGQSGVVSVTVRETDPVLDRIGGHFEARATALLNNQPNLLSFLKQDGTTPGGSGGFTFQTTDGRLAMDGGFARDGVWGEVSGSYASSISESGDTKSVLGSFGIHLKYSDRFLVGAMLQFDLADHDLAAKAGTIDGTGWLVGPYFAAHHDTQPLYFEGRLLYGQSENDIRFIDSVLGVTRTGSFDTRRLLAQLRMEGEIALSDGSDGDEGPRLIPYADARWIENRAAAFTTVSATGFSPVPGQKVSISRLELGSRVKVPIAVRHGSMTLTGGLGLVWSNTEGDHVNSVSRSHGRGEIGFSYGLDDNVQIDLESFYDGIGTSGYEGYGLSLSAEMKF